MEERPTPMRTRAELLGDSPAIVAARARVERLAGGESTVLVLGESGTGKEVVARALHQRSRRGRGPFVPLNFSARPDALPITRARCPARCSTGSICMSMSMR